MIIQNSDFYFILPLDFVIGFVFLSLYGRKRKEVHKIYKYENEKAS